jgi:hypothetical protein
VEVSRAYENKKLEGLDAALNRYYSQNVGGTDGGARKWAEERLERARESKKEREEADKLVEERNSQLSKNLISNVYALFDYMLRGIDSRIAAVQELRSEVKYEKAEKFVLFDDETSPGGDYVLKTVVFKNGSQIVIDLTPGKRTQGRVSTCPSLRFQELVGQTVILSKVKSPSSDCSPLSI